MDTVVVISCQRYFIETDEVNSKGKKKSMAIDVRKMRILGDFIGTNEYEVNFIKRRGFCIKSVIKPDVKKWPLPFDPPPKRRWQREGALTQAEFEKWLTARKLNGGQLVSQMLTCPPDNLAA
jgi:hypothetical protein